MLSRPKAGVPAGARGGLGGFLSRRSPTSHVRAAAARWEVPPERARTIRKKRDDPPRRNCLEERERLGALSVSAAPGLRRGRANARMPWRRTRRRGFRRDPARTWTKPGHDTAGPDDAREAGRSARFSRHVEVRTGRKATSRRRRPSTAASCPQTPRCRGGAASLHRRSFRA